jgi:hypothetical protein
MRVQNSQVGADLDESFGCEITNKHPSKYAWHGVNDHVLCICGIGLRIMLMSPICNLSYRFQGKNSNKPAYGEQWENDKARESSEAFGQKHTAFSEICGRATSDNRSAWHVRHCTAEDGWLGREMPHTAETMG